MRLSRFVVLCISAAGAAGCGSDNVTNPAMPPVAGVRFINAVNDTGAVDIRAVDQVQLSPVALALLYRQGTEFQPTEAKSRHIRVFPTSRDPAVTSQVMLDTTITFAADSRVTLLLSGSARAKTLTFVVIDDKAAAPTTGQIALRAVSTAASAVNAYLAAKPSSALPASPLIANVGTLAPSAYVSVPAFTATDTAEVRFTNTGSTTVSASAKGPLATTLAGALPAAGFNSAGTVFSIYYFPASVKGSAAPQTAAFLGPAAVWFVDRNPADTY